MLKAGNAETAQKPKSRGHVEPSEELEFGQGEAWQVTQVPALCQAALSFGALWRTPGRARLSEMEITFSFYLKAPSPREKEGILHARAAPRVHKSRDWNISPLLPLLHRRPGEAFDQYFRVRCAEAPVFLTFLDLHHK